MFARVHGPSNPGFVKNGPSGAGCGGFAPIRAATSGRRSSAPLDQWSRPSSRTLGAHPESPTPMPSVISVLARACRRRCTRASRSPPGAGC
jgi:hypothetical protein